jgi:hypothetical protein
MLTCITNSFSDVRSCTFRGEHVEGCTGSEVRWDSLTGVLTDTGRECRGCLPRPAERGMLCGQCAEQVEATLAKQDRGSATEALDLITHLRSTETAQQSQDGVRSAPGSRVILPVSWIAADELYIALANVAVAYSIDWSVEEPEWDVTASVLDGFNPEANDDSVWFVTKYLVDWVAADLDRLFAKQRGAIAAVRWVRAYQTKDRHFPRKDQPRRVRWVKCRSCNRKSLEYRPPLELEEPRVVACTTPWCGAEWDPQLIEFDLRVIVQEIQQTVAESDYLRTAAAMTRAGIDPGVVPIHSLRQEGFQSLYTSGIYSGKYGPTEPWPVPTGDLTPWDVYLDEQESQAVGRLTHHHAARRSS